MSNKILNLDLSKDPIMPAIVYGRVGDDRMQTIKVNVTQRGEVFDLTGCKVTFEGVLAGGKTKVFDSDNVDFQRSVVSRGEFEYTFPSQAFSVAGKYERAYFSVVKDGKRDTTGDFEIIVAGSADIDAKEAETVITEYNKLVKELQELQNKNIDTLNKNLASITMKVNELMNNIASYQQSVKKTAEDAENKISVAASEAENRVSTATSEIVKIVGEALENLKKGDFYTKTESDSKFLAKVDASTIYAKKEDIYTKPEIDVAYAKKTDTVNLTGDQEISGVKNFLENPLVNSLPILNLSNLNMAFIDGNEGQISNVTEANNKEVGVGNSIFYINEKSKFITVNKAKHRIIAQENGVYCFVMQVWVQFEVNHNGYYYLNVLKNGNRAPGRSRLWGTGADYLKNRHDATGIYITSLTKGDEISAAIETNYKGKIVNSGIKSVLALKIS